MSDYSISSVDTSVNIPTLTILVFGINRSRKDIELVFTAAFTHIRNNLPICFGVSIGIYEFRLCCTFVCISESYKLSIVHAKEFEDIRFCGLHQTKLGFVCS